MPDSIPVPVTWVQQEGLHLCGPAVAQMILTALNVAAPTGTESWQEVLWTKVKANTSGTPPRSGAKVGCTETFPKQKCERCANDPDHFCWCTTPAALVKVLNLQVQGKPYKTIAAATASGVTAQRQATVEAVAAIDRGIPIAVLIGGWAHWVVLEGYRHGEAGEAGSVTLGGVLINGVYIRDSNQEETLHFVKTNAWLDKLDLVQCGAHMNKCVIVASKPSFNRGVA